MRIQINSRLWVDWQLRFSKDSVPLQNRETKKPSSKLWKKLDGCQSSALLRARKLTEKRRSPPLQPSDSHNMLNIWKTNMLKMKTRERFSLPKMWKRSTKLDTNIQSFETQPPINQEVSSMKKIAEEEANSKDEVLEAVSLKNLFLGEEEEGDFPTQPQRQSTTHTKTIRHSPTTPPTTSEGSSTLHYAGGWNFIRREIAAVSSAMEEDGEPQMTFVSNRRRLSNTVSVITFPMEDKTDEIIASGSRGNILSSSEIFESRDYRSLTNPKRELFVQLLHDPGTNKETPDSRLYPTEPILQYQWKVCQL
ncbi:unnamed protein product [Rhizopus stolonifer]